jgi:outer membrane protein OmpA-like peptidoglycan-associated protein
VANEPGSTDLPASTDTDAGNVTREIIDREIIDHELEAEITPDPGPGSGDLDSRSPDRPVLSADSPSFFSAQAALSRGMSALEAIERAEDESFLPPARAFSTQPISAQPPVLAQPQNLPGTRPAEQKQRGLFWRRASRQAEPQPVGPSVGAAEAGLEGAPVIAPDVPRLKPLWEKQPYAAIAHTLALSGTLTGAWLLGILIAQILPGDFSQPPLQESILRKSSRLSQRLWHFSQLWQTPTSETRIEAIPLPETGPVLAPISLPPIERQPLIDELNSVDTELLTLDRRLQTLEKRLGKPPYQGAGVENRVNSLRLAIDPPVRPTATSSNPDYKPTPLNPNDQLLEVAQLKITLPSDALFSPGASELKDTALLNQVLDQLVNYPKATILIRSYSDNQAGAEASRKYTQQQALVLSEHLRPSLAGTYRWITVGGGQSQPLGSNEDDTGRQRNRRIEILVDTRAGR